MRTFNTLFNELFQLGLAVALNTLIGIFNNMEKGEKFSWAKLRHGLYRAILFAISLVGVVYIMDASKLFTDSSITPEGVLQAGILFYTSKVLLALKTMLLPNQETQPGESPLVAQDDYQDLSEGMDYMEIEYEDALGEEFTEEDYKEFEED